MATAALLLQALAVAVVAAAAFDTTPVPFDAGYVPLFGGDNVVRSPDGRSIQLKLDRYTGSGFISKSAYHHGFFSASIKLPGGYTAGVVVAFYAIAAPPPPPATEENLGEGPLNRALVFDDSPGKSGLSTDGPVVSSSLTFQGSSSDRSPDDDSSSAWSIQVNVSSEKDDEELVEDTVGELEEEYYTEEEDWQEEEDDDDECFDDLCEGMSKMSVLCEEEKKGGLPAFEGRHTRFVYNSDDEIVERKEVANAAAEHGALLRGLPVPEGKHLRFQDDE